MSGGSGTNNNWTILTSEETVAETLRPFAAGTEQHDEDHTSATEPSSGESNQPAKSAESAEGLPVGDYPASEHRAELSSHPHSSPPSLEVSNTSGHVDEVRPMEGQAEGPARVSSDPEPSSDSYTLLTPSLNDPPPGQAEFTQAEDEETLGLRNEQEHQQQGEESEQQPQPADAGRQADVNEERREESEERGEPEQRRKKSLLAALEQIGRREEEEEEEEEEFQVPQQENNSLFSLNKCILGAVLLLAFGTIFFSGVFMDLHEESDHSTNEVRDTEAAGKQEWLSPEVPPHVGADSSQLLNKLADGNKQISALQAQLQAQNEELKVAKEQAEEGVKERLLWEEMEKENSRLKAEMTSLPVLQKENDRMKRELESVPALQRELETLRSTVSKLKLSSAADQTQADLSLSSSPPAGQSEDGSQDAAGTTDQHTRKLWDNQKEKKDLKRDKYETGNKKQCKELEKSVRKDGEQKDFKKEWKKEKLEEGMFEKEKAGKHKRLSDKMKDMKREKFRGDEGKHRKDEEERGWKKGKREDVNEGKEWKGKEEKKDRQGEKQRGDKKGKEGWRGETDREKVKDGSKEKGKEKWEKKAWKEMGEKEWKKNSEWRDKNKDQGKEGKGKVGKKQWEDGIDHDKEKRRQWNEKERKSKNEKQDEEWKRKDEKLDEWKREQKEKKPKDWKKDQSQPLKTKNEHKTTGSLKHREEHLYSEQNPPHSHRRPSVAQPEYWVQQRDRLRRLPRPPQPCDSPESCAQTQRLLPVTLPEFQAVLQSYLSKAEEAGVDRSRTEELRKLAAEFFKDGVFVHEQMSFLDFVEDVADVLEDLVEGDDEEQEDSALEDEMEEFEKEVVMRFSVPGGGEKEKRVKEEWRKKSAQERG